MRRLLGSAILICLLSSFSAWSGSARACAVAAPKNTPVGIASESAIIVWDKETRTQHFIRRASFTTAAQNFGFLVPTPKKPILAEVEDEAFQVLAKITEPKVVTRPKQESGGCLQIGCSAGPADKSSAGKVEVLEQGTAAGFNYAVLAADDAQVLADWLKQNEYDYSPALKDWFKPYLDRGWVITAFKIARDEQKDEKVAGTVSTKAVRMTFKTDRPFFPYREPQPQGNRSAEKHRRLLRVFVLSGYRVQGKIGDKGVEWPGKTAWAGALPEKDRQAVWDRLKVSEGKAPDTWWLTEFEDSSSPRPGTDEVFFSRSDSQQPVERPPHIRYVSNPLPECIFCYATVAYLVVPSLVRRWRRSRRQPSARR